MNLFGDTIVRWTTNCVTSKCQCYVSCLIALKRPHSVSLRKISTIKNLSKTLCATGHPQHGSFFRPQNIIQTVSKPRPRPVVVHVCTLHGVEGVVYLPPNTFADLSFSFFLAFVDKPCQQMSVRGSSLDHPNNNNNSNSSPHQSLPHNFDNQQTQQQWRH